MSPQEDPDAQTVALLEAIVEVRTLIEDISRLAEELKARQERLGELLVPSEAALKARTEYLDHVMREQLGGAEQRLTRMVDEVNQIARTLSDRITQMPALMVEVDRQRAIATSWREWWRTALVIVAATAGGYLAGQTAACRANPNAILSPAREPSLSPAKTPPSPRARPRSTAAPR
jgi:ABC-type transporter Mla subunit MlaD